MADAMSSPRPGAMESPTCLTYCLEAYNSVEERKLSFERQEKIPRIEYDIVCMLAHNGPQTWLQSQDTAKFLLCP